MSRTLATVTALVLVGLTATPAAAAVAAAPVADEAGSGQSLIVTSDGEVTVTFSGRNGVHAKQLFLIGEDGDTLLFDDADAQVGGTRTITGLEAGSTLTFRLAVTTRSGAQFDLFTGAASLNPRGFANARAITIASSLAMISFEDQRGGGDLDFNDFGFTVDGAEAGDIAAVPAPAAAILMLTGLGGLAASRRRRG